MQCKACHLQTDNNNKKLTNTLIPHKGSGAMYTTFMHNKKPNPGSTIIQMYTLVFERTITDACMFKTLYTNPVAQTAN